MRTALSLLFLLGTGLGQQSVQPNQIGNIDTSGGNECIVEFVIDTSASAVALTASVVQPLPLNLDMSNREYVNQGIQGSFYLRAGDGRCSDVVPTGADLLEELGNGALLLSGVPGGDPGAPGLIEYYPSNITFTAPAVGTTVNVWDLGFNMSLALALPTGPRPTGRDTEEEQLSGELRSVSEEGDVFTSSVIVPQGETFPFGEHSSTNSVLVSASVNMSSVVLNVTDFNVTMMVPYASQVSSVLNSLAYYRLLGNIVLRGVAGCDTESCAPNGRCGLGPGDQVACQCRCGWSGMSCDIQSGYCSEYEGGSSAQLGQLSCPVGAVATTPGPALSPVLQPCTSHGEDSRCNPLFEVENEEGGCICKDGFSGPRCEACQVDAACARLYGTNRTACGTSVLYSSETVFKSYTCGLDGTGLESVIVPGTFYVTCNTTSPGEGGAVTDGSYCSVNFALQQYPDNPITCRAALCSFSANSSEVSCRSTSCTCERDCPDLKGIFDSIEGRPAVISCDERNECTFDIENFFVKLIAPCNTTECLVEGYKFEDGSFRVEKNTWVDPVIAAIPLIVLVAVNISLLWILLRRRDAYFSQGTFVRLTSATQMPAAEAREGGASGDPALSSASWGSLTLSFDNVTVALASRKPRVVLDSVSGQAHAGQVTGIMGPSGSGKTTLISYLSQRISASHTIVSGSVTLGSRTLGGADTKIIGYCPQNPHLLPTLTVYETVMYSAILRLPRGTDAKEIHQVTRESIEKVRLDGVQTSYVGGTGRIRGISGGEFRRVSVAMELVTNPKIVLLDEPTSGLDSSSATQVVSALKSLSLSGCVVILSLHQPSPAMFSMLDRVYLLARGRCLYDGAPGGAGSYLKDRGLSVPPGDSIAEFMLECASDMQVVELLTAGKEGKLPEHAGRCAVGAKDIEVAADDESADSPLDTPKHSTVSHRDASIVTELATLTWRNGLDIVRNPALILLHWLLALGMGIFAGCVFFQVGLDTSGAQNRAGGLIFALAFFAFTSLTTVDLVFQEKSIVSREVVGGYYRRWTYVISKLVIDGMFLRFLPILIFSAPFYPMMGLDSEPSHVALYLMTLGTFAVAVGALSLAVTFASRTAGQASFIMNIILLVCLLNSGFFVNAENMPDWISWLRYLSVFFYGYSVLITNEVSGLLFQFVVEGYTAVENVRGVTFLNILGINPTQTTSYIIILDCMYAIFCLASLGVFLMSDRRW